MASSFFAVAFNYAGALQRIGQLPSAAAPTMIRGLSPADFSPVVAAMDIWRLIGALGSVTAAAMPAMAMSEQVKGEEGDDEKNPRPVAG